MKLSYEVVVSIKVIFLDIMANFGIKCYNKSTICVFYKKTSIKT